MQMRASLGMNNETTATGVDIALSQNIRCEHHQVGLKRLVGVFAGRGDDVGSKGEVGNELSVHDVPLEEINASGIEGLNFGSELRKIAGQDRGGDHDRQGHVNTLVGSSLRGV